MSTRKLILAAMLCGLAILFAGGAKLLQVATETDKVTILGANEKSTLGDMTVSVVSVDARPTRTVVIVSMSGVESADAVEGWRMLSGGKVSAVTPGEPAGTDVPACATTSVAEQKCALVFPAAAGTVTVAYLRAGEQSQWSTAG